MAETKIQWTDTTWNPVRGCSVTSPGCHNCYAMRQAHRFSGPGGPYEGLTKMTGAGPQWSGVVRMAPPHILTAPLRWRKSRRVFVNSMSDLFHESLTNEQIAAVFGVMAAAPRHTFQVLTKRAERMAEWFRWVATPEARHALSAPLVALHAVEVACQLHAFEHVTTGAMGFGSIVRRGWPLPNVHLGVSVEDQRRAEERIPHLLQCPAAVRWLSCEPLLGPVDIAAWLPTPCERCQGSTDDDDCWECAGAGIVSAGGVDWVVVGGESGNGARECELRWIHRVVDQCRKAGVPVFVKQLGLCASDAANGIAGAGLAVPAEAQPLVSLRLRDRKGGDMSEWPKALRIREWPASV